MVNEKSNEELFHSRTEYHKRALNQMASSPIDDSSRETIYQTGGQQIDSGQLYSSLKRSFFKDCKAVLDELLGKIENDRLLEQPSLIRFKEESVGLLSAYIDSASLDHSRALERSQQRSERISDEISKRIGLLTNLQYDSEDLEADLLEYLGY